MNNLTHRMPPPDPGVLSDGLDALRDEPAHIRDVRDLIARRERLLPDFERYVADHRRYAKRRTIGRFTAGLALAASVAIWLSLRTTQEPGAAERQQGSLLVTTASGGVQLPDASLSPGQTCQVGLGRLVSTSARGDARVDTPAGVQVTLAPSTSVEATALIVGSKEVMRLHRGRVDVRVPKLGPARSFVIATPTTTVTVHGTEFTVDLTRAGQGQPPCVSVREGLVEVQSSGPSLFLAASQSWSCAEVAAESASPRDDQVPLLQQARPHQAYSTTTTATRVRTGSPPEQDELRAETASLTEQNQLFQLALLHVQRKQWVEAERTLKKLLNAHPNTPFAAEARAQLVDIAQGRKK